VKLFLSTADASGDLHAAALVHALRERVEALEVFGLGGEKLVAAGLEPVVEQNELAVAGLVEVLGSAPRILRSYTKLRRALLERDPDLALFVDSPDLNLPLAGVAKRAGVRALYYIAPQVWAWRYNRVHKLRERVAHVGVIFPFEEPLLRGAGVPASFLGHPLVDRMARLREALDAKALTRELGLDAERPILGLLPGSRRNELDANLAVYLETAKLVHAAHPEAQILWIVAANVAADTPAMPSWVQTVRDRGHEAMAISSCLLAAPGTVTVEAALLGVPFLVAHRTNPLSFELIRRIARVPSSCMVNLIAERGVVSERIQGQARPAALAAELGRWLAEPAAREHARGELERAVSRLGPPGASARAANWLLEQMGPAA
jgi:lipid-A-disaccharide synthase